jgi:hypothetical protein
LELKFGLFTFKFDSHSTFPKTVVIGNDLRPGGAQVTSLIDNLCTVEIDVKLCFVIAPFDPTTQLCRAIVLGRFIIDTMLTRAGGTYLAPLITVAVVLAVGIIVKSDVSIYQHLLIPTLLVYNL